MRIGWDPSNTWYYAHAWIIATDRAVLHAGAKAAAVAACSRITPGGGSICGYMVDRAFKFVNPQGLTNRGVWGEVYPSGTRLRGGRWG
jgi:hypothetical protein